MAQTQESNSKLAVMRNKLLLSLAINGLVPYLVYLLLRPLLASDAAALAVAGAIPAVRTIGLWIWRRRVDWIGVHAVLGFVFALLIFLLLGGNDLLLKIHGTLLTGTIGLVLLASVVLRKPLLLPLFLASGQKGPDDTSLSEQAAVDPIFQKRISARISVATLVIGLALCANTLAHLILALTLSTVAYLGYSRIITIAILGSGAAILWWMRRRASLAGF